MSQPGKTGEIVWTFNRAGDFDFACLIAGHYQAGMVGKIARHSPTDARLNGSIPSHHQLSSRRSTTMKSSLKHSPACRDPPSAAALSAARPPT